MRKVASKYMLGLSATPKRKDRLQWVFESFIGPIVYMTKDVVTEGVEVNVIDYYSEDLKEKSVITDDMAFGEPIWIWKKK